MIKVGDWVEVTEHEIYYSRGERFKVSRIEDGFVYDQNDIGVSSFIVQVVKETEAEKRGAKFGVGAILKSNGKKGIFWCESDSYGKGMWVVFFEDGGNTHASPSQIRLDHEPEYKEIPFSEATHEQRMDISALRFDDGPVEQIFQFDNGEYAFTIPGCKIVCTVPSCLTVRVPA